MGTGSCALLASSFGAVAGAQNVSDGRIDVVQVNGLIDPANAALIRSSLRDAERVHSAVVVFQMDASGAVDVDVNALLNDVTHASVAVTVWVGPSGGGARGAAALLARSADFAAVAPGAHLGPVDPIRFDDTSFTVAAPLKVALVPVPLMVSRIKELARTLAVGITMAVPAAPFVNVIANSSIGLYR